MGKPIAGINKNPFDTMGYCVDGAKINNVTYTNSLKIYKQRSVNIYDLQDNDGNVYQFIKLVHKDQNNKDLNYFDNNDVLASTLSNNSFFIKIQDPNRRIFHFIRMFHNRKFITFGGHYIFEPDDLYTCGIHPSPVKPEWFRGVLGSDHKVAFYDEEFDVKIITYPYNAKIEKPLSVSFPQDIPNYVTTSLQRISSDNRTYTFKVSSIPKNGLFVPYIRFMNDEGLSTLYKNTDVMSSDFYYETYYNKYPNLVYNIPNFMETNSSIQLINKTFISHSSNNNIIEYISSDPEVATFDHNTGILTTYDKEGTTQFKVSFIGSDNEIKFLDLLELKTYRKMYEYFYFEPSSDKLVERGETVKFSAYGVNSDGTVDAMGISPINYIPVKMQRDGTFTALDVEQNDNYNRYSYGVVALNQGETLAPPKIENSNTTLRIGVGPRSVGSPEPTDISFGSDSIEPSFQISSYKLLDGGNTNFKDGETLIEDYRFYRRMGFSLNPSNTIIKKIEIVPTYDSNIIEIQNIDYLSSGIYQNSNPGYIGIVIKPKNKGSTFITVRSVDDPTIEFTRKIIIY